MVKKFRQYPAKDILFREHFIEPRVRILKIISGPDRYADSFIRFRSAGLFQRPPARENTPTRKQRENNIGRCSFRYGGTSAAGEPGDPARVHACAVKVDPIGLRSWILGVPRRAGRVRASAGPARA